MSDRHAPDPPTTKKRKMAEEEEGVPAAELAALACAIDTLAERVAHLEEGRDRRERRNEVRDDDEWVSCRQGFAPADDMWYTELVDRIDSISDTVERAHPTVPHRRSIKLAVASAMTEWVASHMMTHRRPTFDVRSDVKI